MKVSPSVMVWSGISLTTGASFTALTVKVAGSSSKRLPGSVALKVIVSEPYQSASGMPMVATRVPSIVTVSSPLPL